MKCCPGYEINFKDMNNRLFGAQPENASIGYCIQCYAGYSTDDKIRFNSSSGGIVTQLLIYALENGIIDGALVVRMKKEKPLEPEAFIARTKDELLSSSKSKYCPVTIAAGLAEILREDGKFAVVGLPCHIQGIRKAQFANRNLSKKLVITIGLFCARETNFEGTRFLLRSINVPIEAIARIDYRGEGWPGGMTLVFKNGNRKFIPFAEYRSTLGSLLFTPQRCLLCSDPLNELADISVGDAWLSKFNQDKKGTSMAILRSKKGEILFKRANEDGEIKIVPLSIQEAIQSQKKLLNFKKGALSARLSVWSYFNKSVPRYVFAGSGDYMNIKRSNKKIKAILQYVITHLSSRRDRLPSVVLFGYGMFMKVVVEILYLRYGNSNPYWSDRSNAEITRF